MRFGYWLPVFGGWLRNVEDEGMSATWDYVSRLARRSEQIGFDLTLIAELNLNDIKGVRAPSLHAWSTAAALAAVTERLEIMVAVRPTFHAPALLAKQAANIDRISGGRLSINVVSSWWASEARMYGVPFDQHDERYARTGEWLDVVDRLWRQPTVSVHGRFYTIDDAVLEPKPVRTPRPTIYAGGESPAARELISRTCDAWLTHGDPPEVVGQRVADMRARRAAHGLPPMAFGTAAYAIVRETEGGRAARTRPDHGRPPERAGIRQLSGVDREHTARSAGQPGGLLGVEPRAPERPRRNAGAGRLAHPRVRAAGDRSAAAPVQPAARGDGAVRRGRDPARQRRAAERPFAPGRAAGFAVDHAAAQCDVTGQSPRTSRSAIAPRRLRSGSGMFCT